MVAAGASNSTSARYRTCPSGSTPISHPPTDHPCAVAASPSWSQGGAIVMRAMPLWAPPSKEDHVHHWRGIGTTSTSTVASSHDGVYKPSALSKMSVRFSSRVSDMYEVLQPALDVLVYRQPGPAWLRPGNNRFYRYLVVVLSSSGRTPESSQIDRLFCFPQ